MNLRNLAIWAVIALLLIGAWSVFTQGGAGAGGRTGSNATVSYSEIINKINDGTVQRGEFRGDRFVGESSDGRTQ